jgi:hypothetical protein
MSIAYGRLRHVHNLEFVTAGTLHQHGVHAESLHRAIAAHVRSNQFSTECVNEQERAADAGVLECLCQSRLPPVVSDNVSKHGLSRPSFGLLESPLEDCLRKATRISSRELPLVWLYIPGA